MSTKIENGNEFYFYKYSDYPNPTQIVRGLLEGIDICQVDPKLFPQLVRELDRCRSKCVQSEDFHYVRRIDFYLDYISDHPKRLLIAQKLKRKIIDTPSKPSPYSETELDTIISQILYTKTIPRMDSDQLEQVTDELRRIRSQYIAISDSSNVDLIDQAVRFVFQQYEIKEASEIQGQRTQELHQRVDEAKIFLEDLKGRWKKIKDNFINKRDVELESIKQKNKEEYANMAKLLMKCPPKTISKLSPKLVDMRRQAEVIKTIGTSSELYDLLKKIKSEELKVENQYYSSWESIAKKKLNQLVKKQDKQFLIVVANFKRDEENINKTCEQEIRSAQRTLDHFQNSLKQSESLLAVVYPVTEPSPRNIVPTLNLNDLSPANNTSPSTFRRRALMNQQIYSKRQSPSKTSR